MRLANYELTAGAYDSMPGDAAASGRRGHGVTDYAGAAANFRDARDLSIGCYTAARDSLHYAIDDVPGHGLRLSIRRHAPSKLAGRVLVTRQFIFRRTKTLAQFFEKYNR